MIIDGLINIIFNLIDVVLMPLQAINWNFDNSVLNPILDFISMALWLIPVKQLMPIILTFVALMAFRVAISILKTINNIIPFI